MPEFPLDLLAPRCAWLTLAAGLLGVLLGAALAHWLAIGRERRKAFHGVNQQIRVGLLPGPGLDRISSADVDLYCRLASPLKRFRMRRALHRYEEAKRQAMRRDKFGGVHYEPTPQLLRAHRKLLRLTR